MPPSRMRFTDAISDFAVMWLSAAPSPARTGACWINSLDGLQSKFVNSTLCHPSPNGVRLPLGCLDTSTELFKRAVDTARS